MNESQSIDEQLVQRLPLPLAQLCRRARNAKTCLERHQAAFYLWEAALKLLGSVAVVEYAERGDHDPAISERLKSLARPSLGHWWDFVRSLVPVLAEGDAGFSKVRDVLLGKVRDDMPRVAGLDAALIEALEGRTGARSTVRVAELIDRLVQYRNREIGHGAAGQKPAEVYDRLARALLAGAVQLLERVDVLAGRTLLFVGEVRRQASGNWLVERYALSGESAKRIESLEMPEAESAKLPRPERIYLEGNRTLRALYPLLHFDAAAGLVYFLNARRGKQGLEYLCYASGETLRREELGADHRVLLAQLLGQSGAVEEAQAWADAEEQLGASTAPATGVRTIGEFELLSRLGQGGMGVVYRAWQPSLNRQVALKCMLKVGDPRAEARFSREIRALGRVEHRNVVKVFTSGSEGDQWFYAMELVEGAELSRICDQLGGGSAADIDETQWQEALTAACEQARTQEATLSTSHGDASRPLVAPAPPAARPHGTISRGHVRQVVEIMRQIADAVHALHEAGIVHRDIKPGNIMLTRDGAHPVLMDLGLAQLADETEGRVTRTRQFVGTLRYASPEQILAAGRVDRRTDVYSLGATLWELLTLRPIFGVSDETSTPDLMLRIQTADPGSPRKFNRHIPRDLAAIVLKCLEKDRGRRYVTAADLAEDLGRYLAGEPVNAQPPSFKYLAGKFVRRYRVPLAVASVVLLILMGGAVAAFIGIDQQRRAALDANLHLEEQLYANRIAVAERELTLNQDIDLADSLLEKCPENLRGWEWHYLMRLRDGGRPALTGHTSGLWAAVFSPDGRRLATASIDGTVKVWDTTTWKCLRTFEGHLQLLPVPVICVAFSPDGKHIASGSLVPNIFGPSTGQVKIWETETGKVIQTYDKQLGLVTSVAFSPDGKRLASSSVNKENVFHVWDIASGQTLHTVKGHTGQMQRLRFSPDGRLLLSAAADGTVRFWDGTTLKDIRTLEAHPAPVRDVAFDKKGERFATAGLDGLVHVWDTATATRILSLHGHTGSALGVAFSPDGSRLASVGFDKTVRVWDARNGGEAILTLRGHLETVFGIDFSPDGKQLVSAGFDDTARVWDATPADEVRGQGLFSLKGHSDRVNSVVFSPKGDLLASGSWDMTVRLWDAQTGEPRRTLEGHKGAVWGVAFSPDGKRLASAGWDHTVKIWDVASGKELLAFTEHTTPVHSVAFSPDGKRLASTSWEGLVKIWDGETGKEIHSCDGHLFPTMACAWSPDGKTVASGSGDRKILIWDAQTGQPLHQLLGHTMGVYGVTFSPDGKRLASASWDYSLKIWDPLKGKELLTLHKYKEGSAGGHKDRVNGVAYSPDGKRIASASEDKTVRIWDAETGKELMPPLLHRGVCWSVAFSPDGKRLAVGTWTTSGWVKTWNVEPK